MALDDFDMTDWRDFDWRRFIAQRPDASEIIGTGITKFEFRWLQMRDSNTGLRRTDFIVHRADGTGVRLHPQDRRNDVTGLREAGWSSGSLP